MHFSATVCHYCPAPTGKTTLLRINSLLLPCISILTEIPIWMTGPLLFCRTTCSTPGFKVLQSDCRGKNLQFDLLIDHLLQKSLKVTSEWSLHCSAILTYCIVFHVKTNIMEKI